MGSNLTEKNIRESAFIMQFSDSVLPVGAYAHSFGLEGMIQQGLIDDLEGLREFLLKDVWHSLAMVDLQVVAEAYVNVRGNDLSDLNSLDIRARALRPTKQLREAGSRLGKQILKLYQATWQDEEAKLKKSHFKSFQSSVVMGAIFAEQGIELVQCLSSICYQAVSAFLQATLKLLPCGPYQLQNILTEVMLSIANKLSKWEPLPAESWGSSIPHWDIAASMHEYSKQRLFIS